MLDACLTTFVKFGGLLNTQVQLVDFLKPWYNITKYTDDFLLCLQKNNFLPPSLDPGLDALLDLLSKIQKKATLKALRTTKKLKYIDNPKVDEVVRLTALRDK